MATCHNCYKSETECECEAIRSTPIEYAETPLSEYLAMATSALSAMIEYDPMQGPDIDIKSDIIEKSVAIIQHCISSAHGELFGE